MAGRHLLYSFCILCIGVLGCIVATYSHSIKSTEYGWTTQKALEMMLLELPGLLFFSTYTLLVLFWAEIYHQARSLPTDNLRLAYYVINGLIYLVQVSICISVRLSQSSASVEVARLFFSVLSLFAAMGFMIYGGRLYVMLRRFPIESQSRQKKLQEVGYVTGICCTCFLIRCFMVAEILPSAMVLFILRKLPPRRASDQYQSIQ